VTGRTAPGEAEVLSWLDQLSNWSRWGADDERGTLNLIDAATVRTAAGLVRSGEVVSCARPVSYRRTPHSVTGQAGDRMAWKNPPLQFVIGPGDLSQPGDKTAKFGNDAFLIAPHGSVITHLDAPSHLLYQGLMYNGIPAAQLSLAGGAQRGSVEPAAAGIVGHGVLLDVAWALGRDGLAAGEAIFPGDLQACERAAGVRAGAGDIVLVRSGFRGRRPDGSLDGRPGLQAACLPWLRERDIAVLGSDVTQDIQPHGYAFGSPIHTVGIWSLGLWLLDNCALDDLAAACLRHQRWEFLLSIAPLTLQGGTGSPVNPLALF
jgi:kynurenine formamidase